MFFKLKNPEDENQDTTLQQTVTQELNETERTSDLTSEKPKSPKSPKSPRQLSAGKKKEAAAAAAAAVKKGKKTPNDLSHDSQNADGVERKK